MIFAGVCRGETYVFDEAVSVSINQEIFVPADDMTVVFPYSESFPKLEMIYALEDGCGDVDEAIESGDVLFKGIVDEQVFKADSGGADITVYARSMAAVLLDNECEPIQYTSPSVDVIYSKHIEPFGVELKDTKVKCRSGMLRITKGSSHYRALEKFCSEFLNTVPRIDSRGICRVDVYECDDVIYFDNRDGIGFGFISVSDKRYSRISKVHVSIENGYDTTVSDSESISRGIIRERYMSLLDSKTGTLSDAYDVIESGAADSFSVSLKCGERLINMIGAKAYVSAEGCEGEEFVVSRIKYISDGNGERTSVLLRLRG